ncbi:TPA: type II toxin-antitoxin system VapC family toxin [Candidatus Woesearchaeota archaeon]|nr:type II toxin-antitoxin system VapC family toxin [Candidatus Woesearchaeota archaeon]
MYGHENTAVLATTSVNLFELFYGAYKSGSHKNILEVKDIQNSLHILNLSSTAVERAGKTLAALHKAGTLIEFRDVLIGTIAEVEGFSLKTYNKKHFSRIPHLELC